MYAKITRDLIAQGDWDPRTGVVFDGAPVGDVLKVRLLDDDRDVYYLADADDEALEPLLSWAARDVGTTILQQRIDGNWVDVIS